MKPETKNERNQRVLAAIPPEGATSKQVFELTYGRPPKGREGAHVNQSLRVLKARGLVRSEEGKWGGVGQRWFRCTSQRKELDLPKGRVGALYPKVREAFRTPCVVGDVARALLGPDPKQRDYNDIVNTVAALRRRGEIVDSGQKQGSNVLWVLKPEPVPVPVKPEPVPVKPEPVPAPKPELPVGYVHGATFEIDQKVTLPDGSIGRVASVNVYKSKLMYGISGGSRLYDAEQLSLYVEPKYHVGQTVMVAGFQGLVTKIGGLGNYTLTISVHEDQIGVAAEA